MNNFEYFNPTKLIFGKGKLEALKKEVPHYGSKVLLVYGEVASNVADYTIRLFQSYKNSEQR